MNNIQAVRIGLSEGGHLDSFHPEQQQQALGGLAPLHIHLQIVAAVHKAARGTSPWIESTHIEAPRGALHHRMGARFEERAPICDLGPAIPQLSVGTQGAAVLFCGCCGSLNDGNM